MEYRIRFLPKRKKDPAFTGEFTVLKGLWALTGITAILPPSANVNFLNNFSIAFDYKRINDSTFFFQENNFEASFNYSKLKAAKNEMVLDVAKTTTYSHILLGSNALRPLSADSLKSTGQLAKTDSIIDHHRYLAKNQASVNTIGTLDSINNIGWVKFLNKNTAMLFTGYYNFGKFDLGPYLELIRWNNVEGLRLSFSGRTSEQLSKRFLVGGKLGYGFSDQEWKYGGSFGWKFKTDKRSVIGLEYEKDLLLLGALGRIFLIKGDDAATGEDSFVASFFKRWQNDRRSMLYSFKAYIEREIPRKKRDCAGWFSYGWWYGTCSGNVPICCRGSGWCL